MQVLTTPEEVGAITRELRAILADRKHLILLAIEDHYQAAQDQILDKLVLAGLVKEEDVLRCLIPFAVSPLQRQSDIRWVSFPRGETVKVIEDLVNQHGNGNSYTIGPDQDILCFVKDSEDQKFAMLLCQAIRDQVPANLPSLQ